MMLLWYIILSTAVCSSSCQANTALFSGSGGGESFYSHVFLIDCNSESLTCGSPSLEEIATEIANTNTERLNITIHITAQSLKLGGTAEFTNVWSLTIRGQQSEIHCTTSESGLKFNSSQNIIMEYITIRNCGLSLDVLRNRRIFIIRSAVHFISCNQVTISNVTVADSDGSGLHIHKNKGRVYVANSSILNSSVPDRPDRNKTVGGNGVIIYIADLSMQSFTFENCQFLRNRAIGASYNFILSIHRNTSMFGKGRGGGMIIRMKQNVTDVTVTLNNCRFENNYAFLGGGLSAQMEGSGRNNKLLMTDTIFKRNGCPNSAITDVIVASGGGVYLSFENLNRNEEEATNHFMKMTNVTFESNCAEIGGGTYFFSGRSRNVNKNNTVIFDKCLWKGNFAHTGSAVDFTPNIFSRAKEGYLPTPVLKDCSFKENSVRRGKRQSHGSGTLYSSLLNLEFQSSVLFERNIGSGIVIVNGIANFVYSDATFTGNVGIQGGAILMIGIGSLVVGANQTYRFENNSASDKGGAIYSHLVDENDFIVSRSCFLQYNDKTQSSKNWNIIIQTREWTASLLFQNNTASNSIGHSIYATSVIPCQVASDGLRYKIIDEVKNIFQPPGIVLMDESEDKQISTEGSTFLMDRTELKVIPGEVANLGVRVIDDFGNDVGATMIAYIQDSNTITVDSDFSCTMNQKIKFSGRENDRGELVVQTLGSRKLSLVLNVTLLQCPPGFKLDDNTCSCDAKDRFGLANCSNDFSSYLIRGFWAGYVHPDNDSKRKEFATSFCPLGFCNYNSDNESRLNAGKVRLPRNGSELNVAICGTKRTGIFCGECRETYTIYYHSPYLSCNKAKPYSCRLGWIFYILSELIPVTLLFAVVLALNISFTTGAVNGFILFSQMLGTLIIDASGIITFPKSLEIFIRGYEVIYGFLNLDFFNIEYLSFCIWPNASVLGMLSFKYITIIYSLLLVLSVIIFMRYLAPRCLGRYYSITSLRNSVIHGLSGFLVLCYGQCITVSFSILYSQRYILGPSVDATQGYSTNRVWFSGNIVFFSHQHLPYAIPALFFLLIIGVIPPLVLIAHPSLNKVLIFFKFGNTSAVHCLNRASKLKPLLDSLQGSFKDDFRFFAGIYFFYRWMACTTYAIVSSLNLFYSVTQALLILMLVVHAIFQPYQKRWHNVLDTLLLADLVIINGFSAVHYFRFRVDRGGRSIDSVKDSIATTAAIQVVFIYLPLVYIIFYISIRVLRKFCAKEVQSNDEEFVLKKIKEKISRSSLLGSQLSASITEESLPYRLVGKEDEHSFREETMEAVEKNTY